MRKALSKERLKNIYSHIAKRYDFQHSLITFYADQRGRQLLVENTVREGDNVLDCGAGTGSTGIMVARKVGDSGKVVFFDLTEEMLVLAQEKVARANLQAAVVFMTGDMVNLPFENNTFDVVLSTYSLCPLSDPVKGALELYRVTKPGGRIGIAHSTEPDGRFLKYLARRVEDVAWRFPWLSMGCRSVDVLPSLQNAGGKVTLLQRIGIPLWPFMVIVVEKSAQKDDGIVG